MATRNLTDSRVWGLIFITVPDISRNNNIACYPAGLLLLCLVFFMVFPVYAMDKIDKKQSITTFLAQLFPEKADMPILIIDVSKQKLSVWKKDQMVQTYIISTAINGIGSTVGSYQTPSGIHYIRRKIGKDLPVGTILKGRESTGVIAQIELESIATGKDHVTSRILWLSGLEKGINLGGDVDSYRRYIYIHGTHEEGLLGQPASKGCIRMSNADVVSLFDHVPGDSLVYISGDLTKDNYSLRFKDQAAPI